MNELLLSKRLMTVVNEIPAGAKIADIGSDHAYLPCYGVLQGIIPFAIAGEVNDGPYQSAQNQVKKLQLENLIDVRKGNGLAVIHQGEVNVITIAGMGGPLITEILETGKEKLSGITRLILQPNIGAITIRRWLVENNWELTAEHILEEDGKIYEVLVADRGEPLKPYEDVHNRNAAFLLGPHLLKKQSEPFMKKWTFELKNWKNILKQLQYAARNDETEKKKKQLQENIEMVEEVLKR